MARNGIATLSRSTSTMRQLSNSISPSGTNTALHDAQQQQHNSSISTVIGPHHITHFPSPHSYKQLYLMLSCSPATQLLPLSQDPKQYGPCVHACWSLLMQHCYGMSHVSCVLVFVSRKAASGPAAGGVHPKAHEFFAHSCTSLHVDDQKQ